MIEEWTMGSHVFKAGARTLANLGIVQLGTAALS
jgi:hypothetical protein